MPAKLLTAILSPFFALLLLASLPGGALADPRDELVGDWLAMGEDEEELVMTLGADGVLRITFDGEVAVVGRWDLVDGKLLLVDESGPQDELLCDFVIYDFALKLEGEGECAEAPTFVQQRG